MKHNFFLPFLIVKPISCVLSRLQMKKHLSSMGVKSLNTLICVSSRFSEMFGCFYGLSPHNLHSLNTGQGWWCSQYWAPTPGLKVCHKAHGNNKYCKAQQRKTDYTSSKMIGTACWKSFLVFSLFMLLTCWFVWTEQRRWLCVHAVIKNREEDNAWEAKTDVEHFRSYFRS